jgi:hypothetical protein
MLRSLQPQRVLAPPTPTISVTREFLIDFNRIDHFYDWDEARRAVVKARIRANAALFADVPRLARVLRALDVVARHYGWTEAERAEWRGPLARPGAARDYIATLALALQHGYRQSRLNNHMRLAPWLAAQGLDPVDTQGEPT